MPGASGACAHRTSKQHNVFLLCSVNYYAAAAAAVAIFLHTCTQCACHLALHPWLWAPCEGPPWGSRSLTASCSWL